MVTETRYAAGDGTLIGAGQHWLLLGLDLDADLDADLLDDLWALLSVPGPVVTAVLGVLDKHYPDGLPSLVLLDLTPGSVESATRGTGRLTQDDDGRLLALGTVHEPPMRRIVGGVVSAGSARVHEVAAPRLVPRAPSGAAAPGRPLIDGIPAHILAASAPDREPDPHRLALARDSAPRAAATDDPMGGARPVFAPDPDAAPAFEPARPPERSTSLSLRDASSLGSSAQAPPEDPDHDGRTTFRGPGNEDDRTRRNVAGHLRHPTGESVLAVSCPAGHVTAAFAPECRVCHLPVPPQDPRRLPRPRLGVLALPTGEVVPLDRGVVLGRKPRAVPGGEPYPHLVHLPSESTYLSRMHLQIELDGWLVLARDLGSQGGTRLHVPGRDPERLRAHEPYVLEHGHVLDLADVYPVTFEVVS